MAPIKFEEQLKDRLEKRTLSPSSEGWSKLAERLDTNEKKSKNPWFWWIGIAAGLIIMLAVSIQFFNNSESETVMPLVVGEEVRDVKTEKQIQNINLTESNALVVDDEITKDKKDDTQIKNKPQIIEFNKVTDKESKFKTQLTENKSEIMKLNNQNKENGVNEDLQLITNEPLLKDDVGIVLKELRTKNTSVTDREVDSLLKVASKELFKNKVQKEASKTVDADALLQSVQDDMGQSFRTKVFEALKESYKTVKTKVAERNN